jgi:hypothetical protein
LIQEGLLSQWSWHSPGKRKGPVDVPTPTELGVTKIGKGGNKTQAVVLHLLERLPPARYHIFINKLFTSVKLLELFHARRFGATGTCRLNLGVISELVEIKKHYKRKNELS